MITQVLINPGDPTIIDNRTRARWRDLGPRVDCFDCGPSVECSNCANDGPYTQPFVRGDKMFFQFLIEDLFNATPEDPQYGWYAGDPNWLIRASIEFKSGATLPLPSGSIISAAGVGYFEGRSYQNITIDSAAVLDYVNESLELATDCWRLRVDTQMQAADTVVVFGVYTALPPVFPISGLKIIVGATEYRALLAGGTWFWFPTGVTYGPGDVVFGAYGTVLPGTWKVFDGEVWTLTEEPSRDAVAGQSCRSDWFAESTCNDTITIEGYHGKADCSGAIYEPILSLYQSHPGYRDYYRIYASFEVLSFPMEIETNEDGDNISFKLSEQGLLRASVGTPIFYAEKIARTLAAKKVFINAVEYSSPTSVERSNDSGLDWYYSVTLTKVLCKTLPDCEGSVEFTPVLPVGEAECPDSPFLPITLVDSEEAEIDVIVAYPPGGIIVAPDATAQLKDTAGVVILVEDIPSNQTEDIIAPDGDIVMKDTAGLTLLLDTVTSGGSKIVTAPDAVITRDGIPYGNAKSGENPFNVVSAGTTPSGIYYMRPLCTQITSFRTGDTGWHLANGTFNFSNPTNPAVFQKLDFTATDWFYTLAFNNAFGNKFRFTNSVGSEALDGKVNFTGAKTYTTGGGINYYVVDHLTGLGFYVGNLGDTAGVVGTPANGSWNNAIDVAHAQRAAALLGFSDWFPITLVICEMCQDRAATSGSSSSLFKQGIVSGYNESFSWFGDTHMTSTGFARYLRQGNEFQVIGKTSTSIRSIYVCRAHY